MTRRIFCVAACCLAAGLLSTGAPAKSADVPGSVLAAEQARVATIARLAPSVVSVYHKSGNEGGSGVLISKDGFALTNFHVVGEDTFYKCGLNDGKMYDAVLVGLDPTGDVALIKLVGREDFTPATWGDSDTVRVGDWVYVLGNPFLLAADFQPTATYGIVSGIHRYQYPAGTFLEYADCLQVDASVNPGNSGGPLFDSAGKLIGINGRISVAQRGRVNAGAGYAISINQIRKFLGSLHSGRIVDHASVGATVASNTRGEIVVDRIDEESDAYRRGLRIDDEMLSFAGSSIRSVNQFKNIVGTLPEQIRVPLIYRRNGKKAEIRVRLEALHTRAELLQFAAKAPPAEPRGDQPPKPPGTPKRDAEPKAPPEARGKSGKKPAAPPEAVAKLFELRPGFANYHFNRLERARVLAGLSSLGRFGARQFVLTGIDGKEKPFECILADSFTSLELGGKPFLQQHDQEPHDEPPGTGGLLVGLNQLKKLLAHGEKGFEAIDYFGTEPLDGGKEIVDVLVATDGAVQSRWYFNVATGAIAGFDVRLSAEAEDCEVRFQEISTFGGLRFPSRIVIAKSGVEFATLRVTDFKERK